jgi:hypothetical protein
MKNPDIKTSFQYNSETYLVDWYDLLPDQTLPEIEWYQVYAVGNYQGKVPIVHYPNAQDNLPGGKLDPGESMEQALHREIEEELNMRVISWYPIGYQQVTHPNGEITNELRVYAAMEKSGEFVNDPGGNINGHSLISVDSLNDSINYGLVGKRIIEVISHEYAAA